MKKIFNVNMKSHIIFEVQLNPILVYLNNFIKCLVYIQKL